MVDRVVHGESPEPGAGDPSVMTAGPVLGPRRAATARLAVLLTVGVVLVGLVASIAIARAPQVPPGFAVATSSAPGPETTRSGTAASPKRGPTRAVEEPILLDGRALPVIRTSGVARPTLVGGWLAAGWPASCPSVAGSVDARALAATACAAILLPTAPDAPSSWIVYPGSAPALRPFPPDGWLAAVLLGGVADGSGCAPADGACIAFPGHQAVAWQGPPPFTGSAAQVAPSGGVSRTEAIAEAFRAANAGPGGRVSVASALAGPVAVAGPLDAWEGAGSRWVWSVVLEGPFPAPDCAARGSLASCPLEPRTELVVLDYLDGAFLIAISPAP